MQLVLPLELRLILSAPLTHLNLLERVMLRASGTLLGHLSRPIGVLLVQRNIHEGSMDLEGSKG